VERLVAGLGVRWIEAARVEEEPRRQSPRDHRDEYREGDARSGQDERRRIDLHVPAILSSHGDAEVGPKVTGNLGRRRFLALAAAVLATACAPGAQARPSSTPASARPPLAADPTRGIWPDQYHAAPQPVRDAYAWAATHENVLRYIPCYCGCGANGHASNYDCFVRGRQADGWITMDLHGLGCGTCVSITLESAAMVDKGLSVRQIRAAIDSRWSATGPATRTPLP
jgi:hypothetical protein